MTSAPPITDCLPIAIRAYAAPTTQEHSNPCARTRKTRRDSPLPASAWTLVFDTETTTDASQALRFGTYQLRDGERLHEAGIFFDQEGVGNRELALMREYAAAHGLLLRSRSEFVDEVFFARAYKLRATIVGFNLPFDISRLAISHGSARAPLNDEVNSMRGAFTFKLSHQKIYPNIRIKHMSRKAALISFAAPMGQPDARGQRNRGLKSHVRRGHFIDVKTLSSALFARSFSLSSLSRFLEIPNPKLDFDEFDCAISEEMIVYAVRDAQATWECYLALLERYRALNLHKSIPEKIYSEAGIGKAYIREMGIAPWRKVQPDFPADMLAKIMGSYFGGRSEVRIRREIRRVILCDFLSMYPTVCTLMGLWHFVIAKGMTWADATAQARDLLDRIDLAQLQSPGSWRQHTILVRVLPDADIFPVRAAYSGEAQSTIGSNYLSGDVPLWFTLADCIASKLLTGKSPNIVEAISFTPQAVQLDLKPINIAGNLAYRVNPTDTDFFKRVIELRQAIKRRMADASGDERIRLDTEQNALKICANSTSYGIWVEVNVEGRPTRKSVTVHNSTCAPFSFEADKAELPGKYFHPLLASLITGAARLMLAIAERLAADRGLDWAFCDTDSMAFAKPDDMDVDRFGSAVQSIVDWFAFLNPYEFGGSILKIEDVNGALNSDSFEPLYCFAISSKRYALFNLGADGQPVMRKVSAHGLGHLRAPYGDADGPTDSPKPDKSVLKDGTARWHCDLWHRIVCAALAGKPDIVGRDYHPALSQPAVSRYAATSPDLLAWFKAHNADRSYRDQVKPFGFLLSLGMAWSVDRGVQSTTPKKGRPKKVGAAKPIAPFATDNGTAAELAFDRETGVSVSPASLRTYADALAQYHISPESKFLNADYLDRGTTRRRHIRMASALHIGKEAHDWERQAVLGATDASVFTYGVSTVDIAAKVQSLIEQFGERTAAKSLAVPRERLRALAADEDRIRNPQDVQSIAGRLQSALRLCAKLQGDRAAERQRIRDAIERDGLRSTARRLGIDPSNLRRKLRQSESFTVS